MTAADSPRFTFMGLPVEARNVEGDRWIDAYPNHEDAKFKAGETGNITFISVLGCPAEATDLPWPAPGSPSVEIAGAVLEVVQHLDPEGQDEKLAELRAEIEKYFAWVSEQPQDGVGQAD